MGRQQTLSSGSEDSTRPLQLGYARQLCLANLSYFIRKEVLAWDFAPVVNSSAKR